MSVRCPRCDGVIPEKIFKEIQEWGPEAMRCHYCDCPLNKSIFEQRRWDQLFPVPEKNEENVTQLVSTQIERSCHKNSKNQRLNLKKTILDKRADSCTDVAITQTPGEYFSGRLCHQE